MASGKTLPVIVFFLFFGVVAALSGERARVLFDVAEALFIVLMRMVEIVLWIAPLGVFCLVASATAKIGLGVFGEAVGVYMLTVIIGLAIHAFIVLPLVVKLVTGHSPVLFFLAMRHALLTAFSTASSTATLPVTIDCATNNAGVKKETAGFVLPLGSTINMDGTALYEAVAVIFLAQAYGVTLGLTQIVLIAITATLAAIGAAGIPSAGLVTMVIVIDVTNQSLGAELIPLAGLGLVLGVDRLLDMIRTTVNVWGDSVGALIIHEKC
jgi:Na+/H+-dicarboxylate symporter